MPANIKETEAAIAADAKKLELQKAEPSNPDGFNFEPGRPLPAGFENPPCGDPGHVCTDPAGNYQPDWVQLLLEKVHDRQQNPQPFNLGSRYLVPLDTWVDAPPVIIESLLSAVEERHELNATEGQILLGVRPEHKVVKRKRFHWQSMPSAKVG